MASNPANDVPDEDSAVLQFPKDWYSYNPTQDEQNEYEECFFCSIALEDTYIKCAVCTNVVICPPCFAAGCDGAVHRNDHPYSVRTTDMPLFCPSWSARDEMKLLDALICHGYGNWDSIAKRIRTHSAAECQRHYDRYYIKDRQCPELPRFPESILSYTEHPTYQFRATGVVEPPRYASNSVYGRMMSGYNAARGDFEAEYDDTAEEVLTPVMLSATSREDPDFAAMRTIEAAMGAVYNDRLRERHRHHEIVRSHGLIVLRKTYSWINRFTNTLTRPVVERLLWLMQILPGYEMDELFERLHLLLTTTASIGELCTCKSQGISRLAMCRVFRALERQRAELHRNRETYLAMPLSATRVVGNVVGKQRRAAPPLVVTGLPGYEKLAENEQKLCATARIVPEAYLEFKRLLVNEALRGDGTLRLAQARVLIKIDVNKTRKLYDFLVDEGYFKKPLEKWEVEGGNSTVDLGATETDN